MEFTGLIDFFFEVGSLRHIQRSYNQHVLQKTESVAEHSQRVTIIAYILAKKLDVDPLKTMTMAAFHDLSESRTGDSNWHHKEYIVQHEEEAWEAQLKLIGENSEELKQLLKEYKERKTPESQLAKDADNIEYVLSLKELALQGNEEARRRIEEDTNLNHLYTDLAKNIMKELVNAKPNAWYQKDRSKSRKKYLVN